MQLPPPLRGLCAFLSAAVWKLCPYLPAVCGAFYLRLYGLFTAVLLFFIRCFHHVFTTGNSSRFTGGKQWAKREGLNRTLLNFQQITFWIFVCVCCGSSRSERIPKTSFSSGKMRLSHISGIKSPIFHLLCFSGNKKTHPSGEHSLTMTPDCSFRRPASDTCEPMSHSARVSWPFC